ncbi:MAG: sulfite exporter TauE/SafE family protein [Candidatus Fermentithermobacillus carboniphilus]|uniref:Sulfite exporter TauE/SafE family protein n=1 Tax=Candidatus Fermentithermobacillus carboniphilus TaxID=3085328 RepID=A0AAT9LEM5_9FIRM|nr:MAG: sulfite exporter TauE/SafE family protein [Candidatus Fermentithermobacillus carboniphilus]
MEHILGFLKDPFLGPIYALFLGILASLSPCALGAVPLLVGHMAGSRRTTRLKNAFLFILGMTGALTMAGAVAGTVGKSLILVAPWLRLLAGFLFILAGLSYLDVFSRPKTCTVDVSLGQGSRPEPDSPIRGVLESLGLGVMYGLSASPCATPVLLAILAVVATSGSAGHGMTLLFAYSLGQSFLVAVAGIFAVNFRRFLEGGKKVYVLGIVRKAGGLLVLAFGIYLLVRPYL